MRTCERHPNRLPFPWTCRRPDGFAGFGSGRGLPAKAAVKTGKGVQETELRAGFRDGGRIRGFLVVMRTGDGATEYAVYVNPSWSRGYRILRTWRDKADRTFRSLDNLFNLPAALGWNASITVYPAGSPDLRRFRGVQVRDGGRTRIEWTPSVSLSRKARLPKRVLVQSSLSGISGADMTLDFVSLFRCILRHKVRFAPEPSRGPRAFFTRNRPGRPAAARARSPRHGPRALRPSSG